MNYYSQFHEDAIVDGLLRQIGVTNKFCVDIGAHDGVTLSNTKRLTEQGWYGIFIEQDKSRYHNLVDLHGEQQCVNLTVGDKHPIDSILLEAEPLGYVPPQPDFMSLDIDGQEYYVWDDMVKYRPRIVCVEWSPYVNNEFIPIRNTDGKDGLNQAGLKPMLRLAHNKNYCVVAITPVNLICVDRALCPERNKYWDGEFPIE
jgi:hypothetical protein